MTMEPWLFTYAGAGSKWIQWAVCLVGTVQCTAVRFSKVQYSEVET